MVCLLAIKIHETCEMFDGMCECLLKVLKHICRYCIEKVLKPEDIGDMG
jgi:hypothetical protein